MFYNMIQTQTQINAVNIPLVAIPRQGILASYRFETNPSGTLRLGARFEPVSGKDRDSFIRSFLDCAAHAGLGGYTGAKGVMEAYDDNLNLIMAVKMTDANMRDLSTGRFVNLVEEIQPTLLEEIIQDKEKLLKQIARRKI